MQVCGDSNAEQAFSTKVQKYGNPNSHKAILSFLQDVGHDVDCILHAPFIISFKGILHMKSIKILRPFLYFSKYDFSHLSLCAVSGSLKCYDGFMMGF